MHFRILPCFLLLLCLFACFAPNHLRKMGHNPPAGVYIALMGLAAAIVSLRKEPGPVEKALWITLITILMIAEVRNLYVEDAAQLTKFDKISSALDATKRGLEATAIGINTTAVAMKSLFDTTQQTENNTEAKARVVPADVIVLPSSLPMALGHQLQFNIFTNNEGSEDATELVTDAKIYLGKINDPAEEKILARDFENWWEHPTGRTGHRHWARKVSAAGSKSGFFTIDAPSLMLDDLRQIQRNALTFYIFVRIVYSDHSGRWVSDKCSWLQNPIHDLEVTKPCFVNNAPKYRATRAWTFRWNSDLK